MKRFQKEKGLTASGEVAKETWDALGTLVTQDPPVLDPQQINAQQLPKQPPDDPQAPPFVTCKAWAIADGQSGKLLGSQNAETQLPYASTTKIMTAYLVLRLGEKEPALLDQSLVFSQRADATSGSTAGIRVGEELTVGELLYGLLLPSGNDASVALAEHFGQRFDPEPNAKPADDPLLRFVAEMNRTAKSLGMQRTRYVNTHGLTESDHLSTAGDLARLTHAALQLSSFRRYIAARQHGCSVRGPGGYQRNVIWRNTNRLLAIEGYLGVKTGTTEEAGACLVSCGRRGDDERIVVVLGSVSSDARYVDTRNLFMWVWRQQGRGH